MSLWKNPVFWCAWVSGLFVTSNSIANNNFFLPGDSYFPCVLDAETLEELRNSKKTPFEFKYSSFGGYEMMFCGYAGYSRAHIPSVDEKFIKNLRTAYARLRKREDRKLVERDENGKKKLVELNPMQVMFYQSDFEFPKYSLGLRYNENWVAEVKKFGHPNDSYVRLCSLIGDKDAIVESWRHSRHVRPLKTELPNGETKPVPPNTSPITIKGDVKAFVLNGTTLQDCFSPRKNDKSSKSIFVVSSKEIVELVYEDDKWIKK